MKTGIFLILALSLSAQAFASENSVSDGSQFQLDKDLVNSLYREAVTEAKIEMPRGRSGLRVKTDFSYLVPTTLTLSNQYFNVDYGNGFSGLPGFNIGIAQSLFNWGILSASVTGKTGFSRKEALTVVHTKSGSPFRDMIQLTRIPVSAGLRSDLIFFETAQVRPYFELSGGVHWLYQSGRLDKALEQGFWIPFYEVGFGANLFGGGRSSDWFGGVDLGAAIQRSFASEQVTNSWALDIGLTLYL